MPAQEPDSVREPAAEADSQESFQRFVRAGLARVGLDVDDQMLAVIAAADALFRPHLEALLAADLTGVEPERGLDVSSAPEPIREP